MLRSTSHVFGKALLLSSKTMTVTAACILRHSSTIVKPVYRDPAEAVKDIRSSSVVLCGGFGVCGVPEKLIEGLAETGVNDLTIVSNNGGLDNIGLGILIKNKQIKRMISSYIGENPGFERAYLYGGLEVEFTPQGTMIERVRAGAAGIPAFYTRSGYGTTIHKGGCPITHDASGNPALLSQPKETRVFCGVEYIMENAIVGDFALVHAWKADMAGNLVFRKSAQNFNPTMAKAAKVTVAEVEELVPIGSFDPDHVHVSGLFVDRILATVPQSRIEIVRVSSSTPAEDAVPKSPREATRIRIARRATLEVQDGMYVNLGIGIPLLLPSYLPADKPVQIHSENGAVGVGPYPQESEVDPCLINAGKETITLVPGASFCSSVQSFEMIRGGHIDMSFLGAFEVSAHGDLANWMVPGKIIKGMGGAMDLASAPYTKIVILMEHLTVDGKPRILSECTMPLSGVRCVDLIITELAVFAVCPEKGLTLLELAESESVESIAAKTGAPFTVSKQLKAMVQL